MNNLLVVTVYYLRPLAIKLVAEEVFISAVVIVMILQQLNVPLCALEISKPEKKGTKK